MTNDGSPPLPDRLRSAARAAGILPGDPMEPFVEAMADLAEQARVLSPEAEEKLVQRVAAEVRRGLPALGRELSRRTAAIAACALLLAAALGGAVGWWAKGETVVVALEHGVIRDASGRRYIAVWIDPPQAGR
jgi:hypothetical protein